MRRSGFSSIARRVTTLALTTAGSVWAGVASSQTVLAVTEISYDANLRPRCTAVRMDPASFGTPLASACVPGANGATGPDRVTRTEYDAVGRVVQVRRAVGTSNEQAEVTYTYTATGQKQDLIDANGNRARLAYDGFDRQVAWYLPLPTRPASYAPTDAASAVAAAGQASGTDYEAYGLDANGNRISLRRRDGRVVSYSYDALNRLVAETIGACPGAPCIEVAASAQRGVYRTYDLAGLETAARFDSAAGADAVLTGYDALGRVTVSTTAMGGVSRTLQSSYDAAGDRLRITHPDGVYFTSGYDAMNRMTSGGWWSPAAGTVPFLTMGYDDRGQRAQSTVAGATTQYGYDGLSRLSSHGLGFTGGGGSVVTGIAYNAAGQVATESRSADDYLYMGGGAGNNRTYTVNGLNQYTQVATQTASPYGYDANGNLTSDGGTGYAYDAGNRLVSATGGAGTIGLVYDPHGRLYQVSGGSAGTVTFLYDGDALVAEYGATGTVLRRYMHGAGVDEPVLWDEGSALNCSGTRFPRADRQGSVVAVSNCAGYRSAVQTYDAYGVPGNVAAAGPAGSGRFQYTGQAWLPELGLYYYKARMYSPMLGRFMQTDPIGYADQVNLYAYVANDPVNKSDPSGMCIWDACLAEATVATAVVTIGCALLCDRAIRASKRIGDAIINQIYGPDDDIPASDRRVSRNDNGGPKGPGGQVSTGMPVNQRQQTGSYTNTHESGRTYSGKGSRDRSQASGRRIERATGDRHTATEWRPANSSREAFKDESKRIEQNGGPQSSGNHNRIDSPGTRFRRQDDDR